MLGKIFISYRRGDDPGSAGRLLDVLKATFEADQLFIDVDNIEPGLDFVQVIQERVAQSQILLAVIGKHWCDARGVDGSRRLDDPSDIVRVEIESALDQNKRVIPVLIGDIKMPTPEDLHRAFVL
jgi:TIR domain